MTATLHLVPPPITDLQLSILGTVFEAQEKLSVPEVYWYLCEKQPELYLTEYLRALTAVHDKKLLTVCELPALTCEGKKVLLSAVLAGRSDAIPVAQVSCESESARERLAATAAVRTAAGINEAPASSCRTSGASEVHRGDTVTNLVSMVGRAAFFRKSTEAIVPEAFSGEPEIKQLRAIPGDPNHIPHDCHQNLTHALACTICGTTYEEVKL